MRIVFDLPSYIEQEIARHGGDANQAAKEAALVDWYRQGKISQSQLAEALGITRMEADGVLKRHQVYLEITPEEHEAEVRAMREELKR
jgi:hypothetical protein